MNRKCRVCNGKGDIWGTPRLLKDDLKPDPKHPDKVSKANKSDRGSTHGLGVTCWKCLGKGYVHG